MKESEEDLAAGVVQWLTADGWEVFQEVQIMSYGERADIVARRDGILWVIECKKSLTFDVISQASRWMFYAHHGSVAVPETKTGGANRGRELAYRLCMNLGVGVLTVGKDCNDGFEIVQRIGPRLQRIKSKIHKPIIEMLNRNLVDERKTYAAAGNVKGKYWTPFQETCREARSLVKKKPGITLKGLIDGISHHYANPASARGSLSKWIRLGKVKGIKENGSGRKLQFYPAEES